jgi:hypothetical protein
MDEEDAELGEEAEALLAALVAVWERLPVAKRHAFGVEPGIKIVTITHAARREWSMYGRWADLTELEAAGMVVGLGEAPAHAPYPRHYRRYDVTAKGQGYVHERRRRAGGLRRLGALLRHRPVVVLLLAALLALAFELLRAVV